MDKYLNIIFSTSHRRFFNIKKRWWKCLFKAKKI